MKLCTFVKSGPPVCLFKDTINFAFHSICEVRIKQSLERSMTVSQRHVSHGSLWMEWLMSIVCFIANTCVIRLALINIPYYKLIKSFQGTCKLMIWEMGMLR